jgi:hypothetical protein
MSTHWSVLRGEDGVVHLTFQETVTGQVFVLSCDLDSFERLVTDLRVALIELHEQL